MRKYKMALCLILIVLMAAFILFVEASNQTKFIILIVGLLVLAFLNRGNQVYAKATKIIARKNPLELEKGVKMMEKALDLGCSENNTVIAATLVLQHGDIEKARKNLEEMTASSSKNIRNGAKLSLSMYYWMIRDVDKAIALAEDVKKEKTKSANLYANLCTYYLAKNDKKNYRKTLAEAFHYNATSIALIDIQAVYFILSSDYKKAGITLEKLFSQIDPTYPDPYINYALVYLHYGRLKKAEELAATALQASSIMDLAVYQRDFTEGFHSALSDPYRRIPMMNAVGKNLKQVMIGKLPEVEAADEPFDGDVAPDAPELPSFSEEKIGKKRTEDVSTDLTSSDEEWIRTHGE